MCKSQLEKPGTWYENARAISNGSVGKLNQIVAENKESRSRYTHITKVMPTGLQRPMAGTLTVKHLKNEQMQKARVNNCQLMVANEEYGALDLAAS